MGSVKFLGRRFDVRDGLKEVGGGCEWWNDAMV